MTYMYFIGKGNGARRWREQMTTARIVYEWDAEIVDPSTEDIIDHQHANTAAEVVGRGRVVLIRNLCCEIDGVLDRQWAYVEDGKLPTTFDGGARVPNRFRKELAKAMDELHG